jgi:hypothetical protein
MIVFKLRVISCDGRVETRWLRSKNCDGDEQKTTAYIPEDTFSADAAVYGKTWPTKYNFFCSVERRPIAGGCFQNIRLNKKSLKTGVRTVTEDIDWIIEFERLARPRLQKIFEKDLVGIPAGLAERLEQLRKKEASTRAKVTRRRKHQ